MRYKSLLILPIVSIIGISLALHICASIFIHLAKQPFNKRNKSEEEEEDQKVVTDMWKCRKCAKPVYFAERKCSLGYDWHPQCLKCEECGKRLNPGQHAEHKGVPYCYIPCYGALFGPTLYGHGSKVESHTSFGKVKEKTQSCDSLDKSLEAKLKEYNQFYDGKSGAIHYRERNGKLILEGAIRIYWDVSNVITLKEDNDDRVFVKKRSSYYESTRKHDSQTVVRNRPSSSSSSSSNSSDDNPASSPDEDNIGRSYKTLPKSVSASNVSQKEKKQLSDEVKRESKSFDDEYIQNIEDSKAGKSKEEVEVNEVVDVNQLDDKASQSVVNLRRSSNIRRSRVKLKRRCSINGHYYNRETSKFTPAPGSITSVYITSMVNPTEVINMLLDKFKVTNKPEDFALFVVKDNGECKKILDDEFPLIVRVRLGPNEDVAKFFILNKKKKEISNEVAQYLHFSNVELNTFLRKFEEEEMNEVEKVKKKYDGVKDWIKLRIKELQL